MGRMLRADVTLDTETADAIDEAITRGQFADEAELLRYALLLWMDWRREQEEGHQQLVENFGIEKLRAMIEEGFASGEPVEADDTFFEDIKKRGTARLAHWRAAE